MLFFIPMENADCAVCESEEAGFVKVLTRKGTYEILVLPVVAAHGGDSLHAFVSR